jgi:hypothetical protein
MPTSLKKLSLKRKQVIEDGMTVWTSPIAYQLKSQVLNHRAFSHSPLVHVFPYTSGLKIEKFQMARIITTAAIWRRQRGRSVDVKKSNTAQSSKIAKYKAGR